MTNERNAPIAPRLIIWFIFAVSLLWFLGFISDSIFGISPVRSFVIKQLYAPVCHQIPGRCFEVNGSLFFVCARCTGIYTGWLLGLCTSLIFYKKAPRLRAFWFIYAALPVLLDVVLYNAGLYHYKKSTAFATGFLSGGIISVFFSLYFLTQESSNA